MKRLICFLAATGLLAGTAWSEEMFYVIEVKPALVYIDAGVQAGVGVGDAYLILSEEKDSYAQVGEVNVIRVAEKFCIAEIVYVEEGKEIEVLQRAVPRMDWEEIDIMTELGEEGMVGTDRPVFGTRFVYFLAGGEWSRETADLDWGSRRIAATNNVYLADVKGTSELGLNLRLGKVAGNRWRFNLTFRIAGKPLGVGDGDVEQLAIEGDVHYLFRDYRVAGPYIGLGLGMHLLSWDVEPERDIENEGGPAVRPDESTFKPGINLLAGMHVPLGQGRWSLLLESGYQWVGKWDGLMDASNVRGFVGLGQMF